jgi:hypothetical protein
MGEKGTAFHSAFTEEGIAVAKREGSKNSKAGLVDPAYRFGTSSVDLSFNRPNQHLEITELCLALRLLTN